MKISKSMYLVILMILLLGIWLLSACSQPGADPGTPDEGGGVPDPLGPEDPEYPTNVHATLTDNGTDLYVSVSWEGNPNDGSYSIIWDTEYPYSGNAAKLANAVSDTQCELVSGNYATYYFWVACADAEGELISGWTAPAEELIEYTEDPPPIGAPELIIETDSGLRVVDGDTIDLDGFGIGIYVDLPDNETYPDKVFQCMYNGGDWYTYTWDDGKVAIGSADGENTVSIHYFNESTGLEEPGTLVSASYTVADLTGPTIVSLNDANGDPIVPGSTVPLAVTLTAAEPDGISGGDFEVTTDGSTWNTFSSAGSEHIFDPGAGNESSYDSVQIRYNVGGTIYGPTNVSAFTVDMCPPAFSAPTVSSEDLAVSVAWNRPADADLESLSIEYCSAGSGEYEEWVSYTGSIAASGTDYIPASETIDIKMTAVDDAGNSAEHEFLNRTPNTSLEALFVTPGGTGLGGNWQSALGDLQEAIEYAAANDIAEVRVREGTYKPASAANIDPAPAGKEYYHFSLRNGVTVIGGFTGTETDNIPTGGTTTLSGYFSDQFGYDDAYHVFYHPGGTGLNDTAVLKNVTICDGHADKYISSSGSYSVYTLGGGMFNENSSPLLIDCTFSGNEASKSGGAIYNSGSSPTLINCCIMENETTISATDEGGSGVHNAGASAPLFINTIFLNNSAFANGGGVYNKQGSSAVFYNCTFYGNSAGSGASHGQAVYNLQSYPEFYNTIIWNNTGSDAGPVYDVSSIPTYSSCLINIVTSPDPLTVFIVSSPDIADDLKLNSTSDAIDGGSSADLPEDSYDLDDDGDTSDNFPVDFGGTNRIQGSPAVPDIGAWEY